MLIGLLTWIVFLNRAGGSLGYNWPVSWDLSNSDNGVLYQLSQDIFKGRHLDWSFSPQVYIFPELPISLVSYALAAGSVYGYYIWVAIFNNMLLFLAFFVLIKAVTKKSTYQSLYTALFASLPLLFLPLLSTNTLFDYQLAPTYYYGAYLFTFITPLVFFARKKRTKIAAAIAYSLTAASNPLLLAFSIPALLVVLSIKFLRDGLTPTIKNISTLAGLVVLSEVIRTVFFKGMVGASPSSYIGIGLFDKRLHNIKHLLIHGFGARYDHFLLALCLLAFVVCVALAFKSGRRYIVNKDLDSENLTLLYLNLVPVATLLALYISMVISPLYLWIIIVAPLPIVLLQTNKHAKALAVFGLVILVVLLLLPKSLNRVSRAHQNYFSYKPSLTACLDSKLPAGQDIGYATFSDARKSELTSSHQLLLIEVLRLANPGGWLTNKSYATDLPGSFFVINPGGDEAPINGGVVVANFGIPDRTFTCDGNIQVLSYDNPGALKKIADFYKQNSLENKR